MAKDKGFSALASEYFVAAELLRRGYHASITIGNAKTVDIIAASENGDRSVTIQVKSTITSIKKSGNITWQMKSKAEKMDAPNLFYVFVHLDKAFPEYYVVPSSIVAEFVKSTHRKWLRTPGKKGQPHNDNDTRVFEVAPNCEYRDAWHLLGLERREKLNK